MRRTRPVAVLLLCVACTASPGPGPAPPSQGRPTATVAPPLQPDRAVSADVSFDNEGDGHFVSDPGLHELKVGPTSSALFALPRLGRLDCVAEVRLWLYWLGGHGAPGQLAAYPAVEDARKLHEGQDLGSTTLADNRPRGDSTNVPHEPGWVVFDITDLYSQWVEKDGLLVEVRQMVLDSGVLNRFVSSEGSSERAPKVRWRSNPNCP